MTWLDQNRNVIFIILLLAALGGMGGIYLRQPPQNSIEIAPVEATATTVPLPPPTPTSGQVRVYVTGAVVKSDVYSLPAGSIIKEAILAAGGFTPDADPERINQAQELKDQQQIHVPRKNEENPLPPVQGGETKPQTGAGGSNSTGARGDLININTASLEQLVTLPGIGPAIGQRIIDYRENSGEFDAIEAITEVSGIGEATFSKIKDRITVTK